MAEEHAMFKFDDLKVISHYDRQTTKVLSSRPRINAARPIIDSTVYAQHRMIIICCSVGMNLFYFLIILSL